MSNFQWYALNVCFHVCLGSMLYLYTFCFFFLAKNCFIDCFNRLNQTNRAKWIDSVAFSAAIYRLNHQSTRLDRESNQFNQYLRKNRYQLNWIDWYTSLVWTMHLPTYSTTVTFVLIVYALFNRIISFVLSLDFRTFCTELLNLLIDLISISDERRIFGEHHHSSCDKDAAE